jgi:hypothetical protein
MSGPGKDTQPQIDLESMEVQRKELSRIDRKFEELFTTRMSFGEDNQKKIEYDQESNVGEKDPMIIDASIKMDQFKDNHNKLIEQRDALVRQMQIDLDSEVVHYFKTKYNCISFVRKTEKFISDLSDPDYVHVDFKKLDHAQQTLPEFIGKLNSSRQHNNDQVDRCLIKILKFLRGNTQEELQTYFVSLFAITKDDKSKTTKKASTIRTALLKELQRKVTQLRNSAQTKTIRDQQQVVIAVDNKLKEDLRKELNEASDIDPNQIYTPNTEIYDGILEKLVQIKLQVKVSLDDASKSFFSLKPKIHEELKWEHCHYYEMIATKYLEMNMMLERALQDCHEAELEVCKAKPILATIEKNYQEVATKIKHYEANFIKWIKEKHKAIVFKFLSPTRDNKSQQPFDDEGTIAKQEMQDICREVTDNINQAVNRINEFLDEASNSRKSSRILNTILNSSYKDVAISITPSLSRLENLK